MASLPPAGVQGVFSSITWSVYHTSARQMRGLNKNMAAVL